MKQMGKGKMPKLPPQMQQQAGEMSTDRICRGGGAPPEPLRPTVELQEGVVGEPGPAR